MNQNLKKAFIVAAAAAAVGGTLYALRKPRKYSGVKMKKSILINRPASELYAFWRDFQNLPRLTDLLQSVEVFDDYRSRWTAAAPGDIPIQWDAEVTKDIRDEMIGWQSLEGSQIETAGFVRFEPTRGGRETLVRVALEYNLPARRVGAALATLFGKRPDAHVEEMLRRLKQLMETGESTISERRFAT